MNFDLKKTKGKASWQRKKTRKLSLETKKKKQKNARIKRKGSDH
jgi:hypothetical protein